MIRVEDGDRVFAIPTDYVVSALFQLLPDEVKTAVIDLIVRGAAAIPVATIRKDAAVVLARPGHVPRT